LDERGLPVAQPQRRLYPSVPPALRLSRKAVACLSTGAAAPRHTARLVRALSRSGQDGATGVAGRLVQLLVAETLIRQSARRQGVSILDEGPLQALWSVGLRGDVSPVLPVLDGAPPADLLVVLRVPADVALDRLAVRSSRHSRVQLLPEETRVAEMARGTDLLDDLVEWWSGRPGGAREVCVLSRPEEDSDERDRLVERICRAASQRRSPRT
jgi:hypothetical protein